MFSEARSFNPWPIALQYSIAEIRGSFGNFFCGGWFPRQRWVWLNMWFGCGIGKINFDPYPLLNLPEALGLMCLSVLRRRLF